MNLELENIYNMILNTKCKECTQNEICIMLESKGFDNICNNTLEILSKKIEIEE